MPTEFRSALLLSAAKKLDGAVEEFNLLEEYLGDFPLRATKRAQRWSALLTIATAIHNIYKGIEDAMKVVCRNVDGYVPGGDRSHQEILDQVASPLRDVRPALLSDDLYRRLSALKAFRHVVNHNYANDLREDRVLENLEIVCMAFPLFLDAMKALDIHLSSPSPKDDGESAFRP